MSKLNPSKKRSRLVHANYYGLVNTESGREVKCLGRRWMSPEEAADEIEMRDRYRDYQNMKACKMDVPPEMEAAEYGNPYVTMDKLRIMAIGVVALLLSIAFNTCNGN